VRKRPDCLRVNGGERGGVCSTRKIERKQKMNRFSPCARGWGGGGGGGGGREEGDIKRRCWNQNKVGQGGRSRRLKKKLLIKISEKDVEKCFLKKKKRRSTTLTTVVAITWRRACSWECQECRWRRDGRPWEPTWVSVGRLCCCRRRCCTIRRQHRTRCWRPSSS